MPKQDTNGIADKILRRRLIALSALVAALMLPAVLYLGYDLLKSYVSPCASISEQTAATLETEIKFLNTEGKVVLGKKRLIELSERAQMTAINLEVCCQVLDAGRLNPEQFLQCKQSARQYEGDLENVVTLVKQALAAEAEQLSGKIEEATRQVTAAVETARATSQAFNKRVVEVKQKQAIAQAKGTPPAEVEVEAQEKEPNNDPLNTNVIELDKWIIGAISDNGDDDYYTFVTPGIHRDWIRVELENRSATLRPKLNLYDADKKHIDGTYNNTRGANLRYHIVSGPNTKYYLRIRNYNDSRGAYRVRVKPLNKYDAFEPNHNILQAKSISLGSPIEAGIMDAHDVDYYRVTTGATGGALVVSLENRSATLRPELNLYNADKKHMGGTYNNTRGANLRYQVAAMPNTVYFVRVRNYDDSRGKYTLTVKVK